MQDITIKAEDIEIYGDDLRAVIRAFADKITPLEPSDQNDKNNLEWLVKEIYFILKNEL